jgi:hypothetical protein
MFTKTIKLALLSAVVYSLAVGAAFAQHEGHGQGDTEKSQKKRAHGGPRDGVLTGEIVDLHCFMSDPVKGRGDEHAGCINEGQPIGFLADGEIYLVLGKGDQSAADLVAEYAGRKAIVTCKVLKHHGMKAIQLVTIGPAY